MKIYKVSSVKCEDDWRFFDITADVFDVPTSRVAEVDCSICALRGYERSEEIRIILPYSMSRNITGRKGELE